MPETVECSECGASYDSDEHPFCPRCGSTARGAALPGAVVVAARRDPGRRRVQGAGVALLAMGILFLVSAGASLLVPAQEAAEPLVDSLEGQPGGRLLLRFPPGGNGTARLLDAKGQAAGNGTADAEGALAFDMDRAAMRFEARQGGTAWNGTAVALRGGTVEVDLPEGGGGLGLQLGRDLVTAASVARYTLAGLSLLLVAGGTAALTLRAFALAAAGALAGAFFGLVALVGFLALGLLFAIPFGVCAVFILRGRRHFRHAAGPRGPGSG